MKKDSIEKYNVDEIVLILLILASDLSKFSEKDLGSFSESIEGRIETLFSFGFLSSLNKSYGFSEEIIIEMEKLKLIVVRLYESKWLSKFLNCPDNKKIKLSALRLLKKLNISYVDPKEFSDSRLNINW